MGNRRYTIYGLCDPDTGELRYVGCTSMTPARRLQAHRSAARTAGRGEVDDLPVYRWIREINYRPQLVSLETSEQQDEARRIEDRWIMWGVTFGRLCNRRRGDIGVGFSVSDVTRDRMRRSNGGERNAFHGRRHSAESKRKMRASALRRCDDPEYRKRLSEAGKKGAARRWGSGSG